MRKILTVFVVSLVAVSVAACVGKAPYLGKGKAPPPPPPPVVTKG